MLRSDPEKWVRRATGRAMKVGFVGLGNQGSPIAQRIAAAGHDTVVWARRPGALAPFRDGPAAIASSLAEVGHGLDLLATCVFDAAGTREILFGPGGVARAMPRGAVITCHSTVSPDEITRIAAEAAAFGLRVLDAPVSGGPEVAAAGRLITMAGGDAATLDAASPVLQSFSAQVVHLGGIGAGQRAKLINNAMLAAHLEIADSAFALARSLGIDPDALSTVLRAGSGRSYAVEILAFLPTLELLAQSQVKPTLVKDVALLDGIAGAAGGSLRAAAGRMAARLEGTDLL